MQQILLVFFKRSSLQKVGLNLCQNSFMILTPGGRMFSRFVLQLLFSEKSQYSNRSAISETTERVILDC